MKNFEKENEEKGSKKSGRKRMKKDFSILFFRPPHMPLNEKQVDKYNSLLPPQTQ
jgi:hypothetical protein